MLSRQGRDTTQTKLACYSGAGFDLLLEAAARSREDILLVDLERLYG